jgi:hypothetical protein
MAYVSYYHLEDLDGFKDAGLGFERLVLPEGFFVELPAQEGSTKGAGENDFLLEF